MKRKAISKTWISTKEALDHLKISYKTLVKYWKENPIIERSEAFGRPTWGKESLELYIQSKVNGQ